MRTIVTVRLSWGGAGLFAAALLSLCTHHAFAFAERAQPLTDEERGRALARPQASIAPRVDLVAWDAVEAGFSLMDWRGFEAPAPVALAPTPPPVVTPVEDLLAVLYIEQVYAGRQEHLPGQSRGLVRFTHRDLAGCSSPASLRAGDRLPAPHGDVRVLSVSRDGVTFGFDDPQRATEVVSPFRTEVRLIPVVSEGVAPAARRLDAPAASWTGRDLARPVDGTVLHPRDAELLATDWAGVLVREATIQAWRDPHTGQRAGVHLVEVRAPGLLSTLGARSGDVVKSINGRPVTSASESGIWWRSHGQGVAVWEILIENGGVQSTLVVHAPPAP